MNTEINWLKIEQEALEDAAGLVFNSELSLTNQINYIAESVFERKDIKIIMVAGPSSSGKTTFSNRLKDTLVNMGVQTHYIGLDDFFLDRCTLPRLPSGVLDFDSPAALDIPLVQDTIKGILNNAWVSIPKFNFITGKREKNVDLALSMARDVVIIEGIHALNPLLYGEENRDRIVTVSIKPRKTFIMPSGTRLEPEDLRLLRRTIRDFYTRGYTFEETAKQWEEVCNAEEKYITPFMEGADFKVDSAYNYELFIYKYCMKKYLSDCNLEKYYKIKKSLNEVSEIPLVEIPKNSILNEFAILG